MLAKIKCPNCATEGSFSTLESIYEGPYRCWKCRELFTIKLENGEIKSHEPLSQEDFERQQQMAALRDKFKQQR